MAKKRFRADPERFIRDSVRGRDWRKIWKLRLGEAEVCCEVLLGIDFQESGLIWGCYGVVLGKQCETIEEQQADP